MPYEVEGDLHCWTWTGLTSTDGTPIIRTRHAKTTARRYYWERENGPIPEGKVLESRCGNRLCVRPYHAIPVPKAEQASRARPRKVTPAMKQGMENLLAEGHSQREIARLMGIDESVVRYHRQKEFA